VPNISDVIGLLNKMNDDPTGIKKHPTYIEAQKQGKGVYVTDYKGGLKEFVTLQSLIDDQPPAPDLLMYEEDGIKYYFKLTIADDDEQVAYEKTGLKPLALFTATGKLVHLMA